MLLSIVIPAYNESALLPATLAAAHVAAAALEEAGIAHEIIVCDNNSTDGTAEIARAAGAVCVFEPVNQIGRARNTGAAAANGDWILFLDADSLPSRALFQDLAACLKDDRVLAGGCWLRMDVDDLGAKAVMGFWHLISKTMRYAAGSFLFVRTAAFREIGGFDTAFFAAEEIDLSKRLKRLAKSRRQEMRILTSHPLTTSARKLSLYKPSEHLKFIAKVLLTGGRTLKKKEACDIWYDGRR